MFLHLLICVRVLQQDWLNLPVQCFSEMCGERPACRGLLALLGPSRKSKLPYLLPERNMEWINTFQSLQPSIHPTVRVVAYSLQIVRIRVSSGR